MAKRRTRKVKSDENRQADILRPLNGKQAEYIESIKNNAVTICTGVWGSSKSFIPSVMASDMLIAKKIQKIVVARPTEGKGKSIGYLKGDKNEKMEGWCAPVLETLKQRLGAGHLEAYLGNGTVELLALEQVKGRSWDNTFILVDEAEDLEPSVAKSLVGRQGINSKIVITGDVNQQDMKSYSGLQVLLDVAKYVDLNIGHIDFSDWEYCVRSDEAMEWGKGFEKYERQHGKIK
mgnify:CR=1 FL=1